MTDAPHPTPLPQPIRIVNRAASTGVVTSWMGGPRTDYAYPRVIEAELLHRGIAAEVVNQAVPAERVTTGIKHWVRDIMRYSPDVVILYYGHMETVHKALPAWLEQHAHSLRRRSGPIRSFYRRYVISAVYKVAATTQSKLDARLDPLGRFGYKPDRTAADLAYLIKQVRTVGSPLVLLLDVLPPSQTYRTWFPGMAQRIEHWNGVLAELVAGVDHPDVRLFSVRDLVADLLEAGVDPSPDGAHFTPEVHFRIGTALADVVAEWREGQPHLLDWRRHPLHPDRDPA